MRTLKNYYFILGISRDASQEDIETAYERWKTAAAADPFQALMEAEKTEAFGILSDPDRRRQFDETLGAPPQTNVDPGGHVRPYRPSEAGVSLQIEVNKERKARKSKRGLVKVIAAALILLAVAGLGIRHRDKILPHFSRTRPVPVSAVSGAPAPADPTPAPATEPAPAQAAPPRRVQPVIRMYDIQTGGVITADRAQCRPQPSSLSRATVTLPRDTAVLVTGEARDENGHLWYRVRSSGFEGWVYARDIRVYSF